MAKEYLTLVECATVLGVTRVRVWQLVKRGELRATRLGRFWFVKPHHLMQYHEGVIRKDVAQENKP